jgi:hypothetical protein
MAATIKSAKKAKIAHFRAAKRNSWSDRSRASPCQ